MTLMETVQAFNRCMDAPFGCRVCDLHDTCFPDFDIHDALRGNVDLDNMLKGKEKVRESVLYWLSQIEQLRWVEKRPNNWTYQLECPKCKFVYSPESNGDGTSDYPYKYCPKCGERLNVPLRELKRSTGNYAPIEVIERAAPAGWCEEDLEDE